MVEWKKYKFWYRTFEVSEKGKIRNERGVILRGSKHPNGFLTLNLRLKDDKGVITNKGLIFHQVIAGCWIENPESKPYVIHKDGDLLNNRAENLEWATPSEKIMHQKKLGRYGNAKLSTKEVLKIKRLLNKKETPIIDIAREFNVSHTQIQRIKRGENW